MPMDNDNGRVKLPSIALINDYEVVVRGLADLLAGFTDRVVVAELAAQLRPSQPVDVTLYDTFAAAHMNTKGLDRLLGDPMCGRVVIYTWNVQPHLVRRTLTQGVSGYLSKSLTGEELVSALERVHAGHIVTPHLRTVGDHGADVDEPQEATAGSWPGQEHGLTVRESEVLALVTQGLSNKEIVLRTQLSMNTIKTYIRNAYRTIDVDTRSKAVRWGLTQGMVPAPLRIISHPSNTPPGLKEPGSERAHRPDQPREDA